MNPKPDRDHLPGLDSLRIYAAALVLLAHAPSNLRGFSLPAPPDWPIFRRGDTAVPFFFTLSGFLITYLLLREVTRKGTVDVWAFYVRRALRIWPLYYLVAAGGMLFYWVLLPAAESAYRIEGSPWLLSGLYLVFLPHLASSIAFPGGLLVPLWSIGVEEHFYLGWAPLLRLFRRHVLALCAVTFAISIAWHLLHRFNPFALAATHRFVLQMKFHYMAAGGAAAWWFHQHRERCLQNVVFRSLALRWLLVSLLATILLTDWIRIESPSLEVVQPFLFAWLITEAGLNPRRLFSFGNRATEAAGVVSYGFYMYHMAGIYFTTALAKVTGAERLGSVVFVALYFTTAFAVTLSFSFLSYRFFEQPILRFKNRFSR